MYLDVHGLAFETSICYRQDQSGITRIDMQTNMLCLWIGVVVHTSYVCINYTMHRVRVLYAYDLGISVLIQQSSVTYDRIMLMIMYTFGTLMRCTLVCCLSHAKGADSLCMVLFSSLVRMCSYHTLLITTPQASCLFCFSNPVHMYCNINGPTPRNAYI